MNNRDRVALVTGASRGIGAACAARLAREGFRLALVARSLDERHDVLSLRGDLTDPEFRASIIPAVLKRYDRVDILINNAGVGLYGSTLKADVAQIRRMWELNFFAPLELSRDSARVMRESRRGSIVNVSSIGGRMALPWMTTYSASKFALAGLSDGLRMELADTGIHVMTVYPGYVITEFQAHVLAGAPPEAVRRARRAAVTADECAEAIIKGIHRKSRAVYSPAIARVWELLYRCFPGPAEDRLARMLQRGDEE